MWCFALINVLRTPTLGKKVCNFVGGVWSPLLANIYLHELDKYMESTYLNLTSNQRRRRRIQGLGNALYVRYADGTPVQA
jgi:hypothetical protein